MSSCRVFTQSSGDTALLHFAATYTVTEVPQESQLVAGRVQKA